MYAPSDPTMGSSMGPYIPSSAVTVATVCSQDTSVTAVAACLRSGSPEHVDSSPSSPTRSNSVASKATIFTSSEGIKGTLASLRLFQNLILGCLGQDKKVDKNVFSLPSNNEWLAETAQREMSEVGKKRSRVEKLATGHIEVLLNYSIYLKGLLARVANHTIEAELKTINTLLANRQKILVPQPSSPSYQNSPTTTNKLLNFSPQKEGIFASADKPEESKKAWNVLNNLAQLRAQLKSLQTEFAHVENNNAFAKECRQNGYIAFLSQLNSLSIENFKVKNDEMTAISKDIIACEAEIRGQLNPDFVPQPSAKLVDRVVHIAGEFNASFPSVAAKKLTNFKKLQETVAVLKQMLETENKFEVYCHSSARRELYDLHITQLKDLQTDLEECDIPTLILEIKKAMEDAILASQDIRKMYEETQKSLEQFDEFKKRVSPKPVA